MDRILYMPNNLEQFILRLKRNKNFKEYDFGTATILYNDGTREKMDKSKTIDSYGAVN